MVSIHKTKTTPTLTSKCQDMYTRIRLIYEFHYDYITMKYCNKLRLLLTETDSLMHETETQNFCDEFSKNKEMFDFSNNRNLLY